MQDDFPFGPKTNFQLPAAPPLTFYNAISLTYARHAIGIIGTLASHGFTWYICRSQISHFQIFQLSKYHEYCILFHPNTWSQYSWICSPCFSNSLKIIGRNLTLNVTENCMGSWQRSGCRSGHIASSVGVDRPVRFGTLGAVFTAFKKRVFSRISWALFL